MPIEDAALTRPPGLANIMGNRDILVQEVTLLDLPFNVLPTIFRLVPLVVVGVAFGINAASERLAP